MTAGELLLEALRTAWMSQAELARRTGLSPKHVNWIIKSRSPMTAAVAVRIERALGTVSAENLMEAQVRGDIAEARKTVRRVTPG